ILFVFNGKTISKINIQKCRQTDAQFGGKGIRRYFRTHKRSQYIGLRIICDGPFWNDRKFLLSPGEVGSSICPQNVIAQEWNCKIRSRFNDTSLLKLVTEGWTDQMILRHYLFSKSKQNNHTANPKYTSILHNS